VLITRFVNRKEMAETSIKGNSHLTSGRLLARNTIWNLIGNGAPLIVAIFSIPILIHGLGKDRFGVLALAWALIGYASLFDIGLGRALTQLVAKKLGAGEEHEVPWVAWTSLLLMLCLGVVGAAAIIGISPWLAHRLLKIPEALQPETLHSFYLLAVSVPAVITAAGLRGLLEAHQRFDLVTCVRIPMGVFAFAGPLLVLPFSRSLVPVVAVLVAGRFAGCAAYFWLCLLVAPELLQRVAWHGPAVRPLLRFGGWMTVSNLISGIMVTMDRFLIGGLVSVAAVTYYATPFEVITKLILIPGAVVGVMFPAFSSTFVVDRGRTGALYVRSVKYLFLILFPIVLMTVSMAHEGLSLWLGSDFAQQSYRVLQCLAVGVFLNCLAQVPLALLQGANRPDLPARLHMIELPCYTLMLYWLTSRYGIIGTAAAWTFRVGIDAVVLFSLSARFFPRSATRGRVLAACGAVVSLALVAIVEPGNIIEKGVLLAGVIGSFALVGWFRVLSPEERTLAAGLSMNRGLVP
jgi:O-antigen/teichoic acid export membrane protein